jgi:hypothetical protein
MIKHLPPILLRENTKRYGILLFLFFSLFLTAGAFAQTVTSDKDDYAPGEVATITGSSWTNDQTVHIEFKEEPDYPDIHIYDVEVLNGTWVIKYNIETRHIGVKFTVTAKGNQSGYIAQTVFTDANVRVQTNLGEMAISVRLTNSLNCSGSGTTTNGTANTGNNFAIPVTSTQSVQLTAPATNSLGQTFEKWTSNTEFSYPDPTNTKVICVSGNVSNGAVTYTANYISCTTPSISTHPISTNTTFTYGNDATFSVVASGSATLTYQWQLNNGIGFANINGATSSSLTLTRPTVLTNSYQYRCVVTNGCGSATSTAATLNIKKADQIITVTTASPSSATYNTSFTVAATATSGLAVTYTATAPLSNSGATYTMNSGTGTGVVKYNQAGDANYNAASEVTANVTAQKAAAIVALAGLTDQVYNGSPKTVTATTTPANLTGVSVSYDGSATAPTNAGSYAVVASLANENYAAANATGTLEIAKATQTITFAEITDKTFGDAAFVIAPSASSGLAVSVSTTGPISYDAATGKISITGAGDATVTAAQAGNTNYNAAVSVTRSFNVAKSANAITFTNPGQQTYAPNATVSLTASATSGAAVSFAIVSGNATVSGSTLTITGAGSVTVKASSVTTTNYLAAADVEQTFTVNKATATLALANLTHTYDGTLKSATASVSPDGLSGVSVSGSGTNAGSYPAVASLNNPNYEAAAVSGNLSISPASSTVNMSNVTATYDGNAHAAAATATGAGGLNTTANITYSYSGVAPTVYPASATAPTNAGTYSVTATYAGDANHTGSSKTATVTINKATATLALGNLTYTYDGTTKLATATSSPANLTGVNISNNGKTDAGTYTVVASLDNPNYTAVNVTGTLEIAKADQTISWNAPTAITYGTALSSAQLNATVAGVAGGSAAGALTYSPASGTILNSGTHTLSVSAAATTNYNSVTETVSLIVNKADQVITWENPANIVYGTALSATQLNATALGGATLTYSPVSGTVLGAGTRTLTVTAAEATNYKAGSKSVSIVVEKAPATITLTTADLSQTFNGSAKTVGFSISPVGVTGVTVSYSKNGTAVTSPTNAGSYEVLASLTNDNYTGSATGTLAIAKAPTTTVVSVSDATYNGSTHSGSANVTGAGSLNQAVTVYYEGVAPMVYTSSTTAPTNAGTYKATATYAESANYLGSSDSKTFTIGKATATLTASAASNLVYDGLAKVGSGSATGVGSQAEVVSPVTLSYVGTGTTTYGPSATAPTNAGTYTIAASFAGNGNYNSANSSVVAFTITKKAASVVVAAKTKEYGAADPAFTGTLTGFLAGDNVAATYSREAGEIVAGGPYAITAALSPAAALGNYDITNTLSTLTITKKAASVTPLAKSKTYGSPEPTLTGNLAGFLTTDNVTASYSRVAGETVSSGPYTISATLAPAGVLGNYNITYNTASFTINAKALVITANNASKYCGQANPTFTVNYDGFVNNETESVLQGAAAFSTSANENSGAGQYNITPSGLSSSNYAITFNKGYLTINSVSIDASASGNPAPVGSAATLSATVTPKVAGVKVIFKLDGTEKGSALTNSDGVATLSVSNLTVNVYQVEASTGSGCAISTAYLPVYDPNGGFVTGGGWINSPAGSLVSNPSATGKANFGFVSRYKKGSTSLEGETEFQFQAGNFKFNSTSYEIATLVISGAKASYRGVGTINGTGTYKFTLTAIDGQLTGGGGTDKIRMKITNSDGSTVYDNQIEGADNADPTTTLGGGSIVIHEATKTTGKTERVATESEVFTGTEAKLTSYPNPFRNQATIEFAFDKEEEYSLMVYSVRGSLIKALKSGKAQAKTPVQVQWGDANTPAGVYIIRLTTKAGVQTLRIVRD